MSQTNIPQAVMEWLQGCPLIEGYAFAADSLGLEPLSLSLEMTPGEPIIKRYLSGKTRHFLKNEKKTTAKVLWISTPPLF